MNELRELYQSVILDHYKKPRNYGALAEATGSADGVNPLCGDHVTVHVRVDGDTVTGVGFEGNGCAISKASASLMTEIVSGRSVAETEEIFSRFHDLVTGEAEFDSEALGSTRRVVLYLPARFRATRRYPLLVVHDGPEYLKYSGSWKCFPEFENFPRG